METIFEKAIERIKAGASFSVDFKKRALRINGKPVELTGIPSGIEHFTDLDDWLDKVENLYDTYKYSRPTKTTIDNERHCKFKALSVSELCRELGHNALNTPVIRNVAQAELELFILLSLTDGVFNPDELFAKDWFYQGHDKSLIIRKDWF